MAAPAEAAVANATQAAKAIIQIAFSDAAKGYGVYSVGAVVDPGVIPLERDGHDVMITGFAVAVVAWWILFYSFAFSERLWRPLIAESTKPHENDRIWITRHVMGTIMACIVAGITVPAVFFFSAEPAYIKFTHSPHLAFCRMYDEPLRTWGMATAFAGVVFTSYTIADLALMFIHGFVTPDYLAHHIFFISAGLIIRCNCVFPYEAAILMAMEASTPFLNFLLMYRNRGDGYKMGMMVSGVSFFVLFVLMRLILNTVGAVELLWNRERFVEPALPSWQAWALIVMVVMGVVVQVFWFPPILKAFGSNLKAALVGDPKGVHLDDDAHQ